jgi:chemotaxis protein methyltransferase WspC
MNRLRDTLHARTGLAPSDADLERALRAVLLPAGALPASPAARNAAALGAAAPGVAAPGDYAPLPGTPEFEALVDLVVVPESWMLRDPAVFTEALRFVQARLAARPLRQVRILSVPCAGGEEPYSMALVLAQAGIAPAQCRIDAVDLSQAAIARARAGRFTRNAFRGADLAFRDRWFTRSGSEYVVDDALRAYVDFRQGNLLAMDGRADAAPYQRAQYDLVFCRNLLIYFDAPTRARAAHAIAALLADDGLLLSGHAEAPSFCANGFAPVRAGFILHKRAAALQPVADVAAAAHVAPLPPLRRRVRAMAAPATSPARAALAAFVPDAPRRVPPVPPAPPSSEAPQDLLAQARRHADAGRLREAEAACRGLLAATPDSADAWFLLGTVQECGGQPQAADASWRRCVYLAPGHYEALCSLAMLHEGLGDTAAGAGFRQRAARIYARRGSASA